MARQLLTLSGVTSDYFSMKGTIMIRKAIALACAAAALLLTACNTIEGAGKDVSSAGKTVAKTADDAK